jgi:hypothetical protein
VQIGKQTHPQPDDLAQLPDPQSPGVYRDGFRRSDETGQIAGANSPQSAWPRAHDRSDQGAGRAGTAQFAELDPAQVAAVDATE